MNKFIEELDSGDCFVDNDSYFIVTSDFKKNGSRLAISLMNGSAKWFGASDMIEPIDIYTMNKESLIVAIKNKKNEYQQSIYKTISTETKNIL